MTVKANYLQQILGDNEEALLAIREIPYFRNCSDKLLRLIFRYGRVFSLQEGEELTREGEFDQWVFIVLSGRLAVYVGDDRVDVTTSSLVGERCILGESRQATLRATEEGLVALGIDMAILDTLEHPGVEQHEDFPVLAELLCVIANEIVNRVADRAYVQIDVSGKYATYLESERVSEVIGQLKEGRYKHDPRINLEIYKYLRREAPAVLAATLADGTVTVDTRRLYSHCIERGEHGLIYGLAKALNRFLDSRAGSAWARRGVGVDDLGRDAAGRDSAGGDPTSRGHSFSEFSRNLLERIRERHGGNGAALPGRRALPDSTWRRRFRLDENLTVDLAGVCRMLQGEYGYSDRQMIDTLMLMLREASVYIAEINASIRDMLHTLSQIGFVKKLESASTFAEIPADQFFDKETVPDIDPMVGRRIMQVHLIDPYLERLAESVPKAVAPEAEALADAGADGAPTAAAESRAAPEGIPPNGAEPSADPDPNALIDSLFD